MTSAAWKVNLNGEHIDTVFVDDDVPATEVKRGLIEHDGYDPEIVLEFDGKIFPEKSSKGT